MRETTTILSALGLAMLLLLPTSFEPAAGSAVVHAEQRGSRASRAGQQFSGDQEPGLASQMADRPGRAQRPPRDRIALEKGIERMRFLRALGLSPEQRRTARRLFQRFAPHTQQLQDELEERRDAFQQAIFAEPYDEKLLQQRLQAVLEKQGELMQAQVESERAFFDILTPEQQAKFRDLHAQQLEIRRLKREVREKQRQLGQKLRPHNQ